MNDETEGTVAMSATELNPTESETEKVERWRVQELEKVGYDPASALELAVRPDVDLHRAIELVEQGCDPELALRILL